MQAAIGVRSTTLSRIIWIALSMYVETVFLSRDMVYFALVGARRSKSIIPVPTIVIPEPNVRIY